MIPYALVPIRQLARPALGQALVPFRVYVTDSRGIPFKGALVAPVVGSRSWPAEQTDSEGMAEFPDITPGQATVRISAGQVAIERNGPTNQTLFVQLGICGPMSLLTTPELIAAGAAAALTGAGLYWKTASLRTVGEILFGAVVFTALYRHSCSR